MTASPLETARVNWIWTPVGSEMIGWIWPTKRHQAHNSLFIGHNVNLTVRIHNPNREKENRVMNSSVQRWQTGHDSLSTIKRKRSELMSVQRWLTRQNQLGVTRLRVLPFRGGELDIMAKRVVPIDWTVQRWWTGQAGQERVFYIGEYDLIINSVGKLAFLGESFEEIVRCIMLTW